MTAPRKHIPECPHCHHPAFGGTSTDGTCWCCTVRTISAESLSAVTGYEQHRFEVEHITR